MSDEAPDEASREDADDESDEAPAAPAVAAPAKKKRSTRADELRRRRKPARPSADDEADEPARPAYRDDVPAFALMVGTPARRMGWISRSGDRAAPKAGKIVARKASPIAAMLAPEAGTMKARKLFALPSTGTSKHIASATPGSARKASSIAKALTLTPPRFSMSPVRPTTCNSPFGPKTATSPV